MSGSSPSSFLSRFDLMRRSCGAAEHAARAIEHLHDRTHFIPRRTTIAAALPGHAEGRFGAQRGA